MQVKLALSLHAPDDELRTKLMPVTKRYPIAELMAGLPPLPRGDAAPRLRRVPAARGRQRLARSRRAQLAALLRQAAARGAFHVNLIAYNPTGTEYVAADDASVRRFRGELERGGDRRLLPRLARPRHRGGLRAARDEGHPAPQRTAAAADRAGSVCAGVGSCDDGRARQHARVGDPPGPPGRAARRHAPRDRRDAGSRARRGHRAGHGRRRELQQRLGLSRAARVGLPLHRRRLPHRRLRRLRHRRRGRARRDALEGRRRGRRALQPELRRVPGVQRARPDGLLAAEDLGLRVELGLVRRLLPACRRSSCCRSRRT